MAQAAAGVGGQACVHKWLGMSETSWDRLCAGCVLWAGGKWHSIETCRLLPAAISCWQSAISCNLMLVLVQQSVLTLV